MIVNTLQRGREHFVKETYLTLMVTSGDLVSHTRVQPSSDLRRCECGLYIRNELRIERLLYNVRHVFSWGGSTRWLVGKAFALFRDALAVD